MAYSPMGEAIKGIIGAAPGANSAHVIRELQKDAEFAAALHPRPTVAYNIISRLRKRGHVVKRGEGLFLAPEQTEPPNGHARGGSGSGEERAVGQPASLWDHPQPADTERR